jgi:hypothetical protein
MAARLVQIFLPESGIQRLEQILPKHTRRYWRETVPGDQEKFNVIVQQRYTERLLEELTSAFGSDPGFIAYVAKLEAVLPAIEEDAATEIPPKSTSARPQLSSAFSAATGSARTSSTMISKTACTSRQAICSPSSFRQSSPLSACEAARQLPSSAP